MRSRTVTCLITVAAALCAATAVHAATGADSFNCNEAKIDGRTLAEDLSHSHSLTQADSQYTDVGPRTTFRDTANIPTIAYRDQRCKVLDYIEKPLLEQEWNQIPPPPSPVIAAAPLDKSNDIDKGVLKRGYGWCDYVDDKGKIAFYSGIYQGVPSQMALDPIVVGSTLKVMSRNFEQAVQKLYPGEKGYSECKFSQWDNQYVQEDQQKQNQFHFILENYKVVKTNWKPVLTSTQ